MQACKRGGSALLGTTPDLTADEFAQSRGLELQEGDVSGSGSSVSPFSSSMLG